jgi:diacylglycerol O-acyltransferase
MSTTEHGLDPAPPTRLSPLSTAFLSAEDVDPRSALVIGSCAVLEGPAPTLAELRELVAGRLDLAPRYRQRLRRTPLDLRAPSWAEDPRFDVRHHVRERRVRTHGGPTALEDLVGELMAARMDRGRPLWDITMMDGLPGGRWALVSRLHHALADGVSGTELLRVLFEPLEPGPQPEPIAASREAPRVPVLDSALRAVRGGLALGGALVPVHGPSVTGRVRSGRRYVYRRVRIDSVRDLRRGLGVTINDVALAAVAGGYRTLLLSRGIEPHPKAVRSLVPVSAWAGRSAEVPDNRVTLMLADLPVDVEDPVARVRAVHERMAHLRAAGEPDAGVWAQRLVAAVPYPVLSRASRLLLRVPQHSVATVTTNVPGPRAPLACLGRRVEQFLPYVPIADQVRMGVAMFSYCGELTFGLTADGAVDDLDILADGIASSWGALTGPSVLPRGDV